MRNFNFERARPFLLCKEGTTVAKFKSLLETFEGAQRPVQGVAEAVSSLAGVCIVPGISFFLHFFSSKIKSDISQYFQTHSLKGVVSKWPSLCFLVRPLHGLSMFGVKNVDL